MIGMVQWVGYLIGTYMIYRGITDALRDAAASENEAKGKGSRYAAALLAMALVPATIYLVYNMDQFAVSIGNHTP